MPRRSQERSELHSHLLVVGRPLGRFLEGVASRSCLADNSWNILDTWMNQRSWDICIRWNDSTFRTLRSTQRYTLSRSVTPWTPRKHLKPNFHFRLGRTQLQTYQVHFEGLVERMLSAPKRLQKANGSSCTFQQCHPCQLGCDCLCNSCGLRRGVVTAHNCKSNTNCERLWFNSTDTDTNFWAGIQWLDVQ